ncbi:MAG: prepilin peptidase [Rubripirellula sp.]
MLAFWIELSVPIQQTLIFMVGLLGGSLANYVIYRCAYFQPRLISPWGPRPEGVSRHWFDRIPCLGWLGLRRESGLHGRGFWIRPLLIELLLPVCLLWLYQFEYVDQRLWPEQLQQFQNLAGYDHGALSIFWTHAVLMVLMTAATFIDFDERTIPDVITIPGTCLGLLIATSSLQIYMPTTRFFEGVPSGGPTTFDSPWFHMNPISLATSQALMTGLTIWSIWCFALTDWRWSSALCRRRGFVRAIRHFVQGLFHYGYWKILFGLWLTGTLGILYVWNLQGSEWKGLLTGLYGLAVGGGVVWSIRIIATWALNMEAMGFGDVTLMAMIGTMVGWQAALIAFFLSPFAAILIVLVRYLITRDAYTPFGPYLCAGTLMTIIGWDRFYRLWLSENLLLLGSILLWFSLAMLLLMAIMLMGWRQIKMRILSS